MNRILIVSMLFLLLGCNNNEKRDTSLQGSWILISGEFRTKEDTIRYPLTGHERRLKILSDIHFTTVWNALDETPEDLFEGVPGKISKRDKYNSVVQSGYNGGVYHFKNGVYSEHLLFYSDNRYIGAISNFRIEVKGDTIFMSPCDSVGNPVEFGYFEKWKKMD